MLFTCYVRKPGNPGYGYMAVEAPSANDVERIIHQDYGEHLIVSEVNEARRSSFQIGGNLFAVPVN